MDWKNGNCTGITLHGTYYSRENIDTCANISNDLLAFLLEWWNDSPYVTVHTSGSTGTPKEQCADKRRMMHSARITCSFLHLQPGNRALLCMPLNYIAGKMMVVRALTCGLDLIIAPPSSHPFAGLSLPNLHFAAMVPLQVHNSLQVPEEKEHLRGIRHLIIGGGAIDLALEEALRDFPHSVWSTYGMTETLSHIALRPLNGPQASVFYTPFEGVNLSLSPAQTLVINAPYLCNESLVTNDITELQPDGRFRILGRIDNVICSGGLKIQIEEVESLLRPLLPCPFAISWIPDVRLGQCTVLLLELPSDIPVPDEVHAALCDLPPFQKPRHVLKTNHLPLTETGKPARKQIQHLCTLLK